MPSPNSSPCRLQSLLPAIHCWDETSLEGDVPQTVSPKPVPRCSSHRASDSRRDWRMPEDPPTPGPGQTGRHASGPSSSFSMKPLSLVELGLWPWLLGEAQACAHTHTSPWAPPWERPGSQAPEPAWWWWWRTHSSFGAKSASRFADVAVPVHPSLARGFSLLFAC